VLFRSVQNLCFKGLLLENGIIKKTGGINDVLAEYLVSTKIENVKLSENTNRKGNGFLKFTDGFFISDNDNNIETFKDLKIKLNFELNFPSKIMQSRIDIGINNFMGDRVAWLSSNVVISEFSIFSNSIEFLIKDLPLAPGDYTLNLFSEINNEIADWLTEVMPFTIIEKDYYKTGKLTLKNQGNILLNFYAK